MEIILNEKAALKLKPQMSMITHCENKEEVTSLFFSNLLDAIDPELIESELRKVLPIEVLISEALKDPKKAQKIKEALGVIQVKPRRKRRSKEEMDSLKKEVEA